MMPDVVGVVEGRDDGLGWLREEHAQALRTVGSMAASKPAHLVAQDCPSIDADSDARRRANLRSLFVIDVTLRSHEIECP